MPEYFGPNSLETLAALVREDINHGSSGDTTIVEGQPGPPGPPGLTPYIGENGNWWIGDEDTGVPASGSGEGGVHYQFDEGYFSIDDDKVSLKTTETYSEADKDLPMTAAGVHSLVGDIDALLQSI